VVRRARTSVPPKAKRGAERGGRRSAAEPPFLI